ncbi:MAG: CHAD domain-containing protein [Cyanobacteriota bacterium]|nr:CHAD domain-containing protein [Cyanobacteriota bacterium]
MGHYAYRIIDQQYHHMIDQEAGVRQDEDPEYLHQMRVGSRRLRTALQVFDQVVKLPKAARIQPIRKISQTLGRLRDLDVQIADIDQDYGQHMARKAQVKALQKAQGLLRKQRRQVFAEVEGMLAQPGYTNLKQAYADWLRSPQFHPIAQLSITLVLPDLLNPLIAKLFLHPGWLVAWEPVSPASRQTLHDLRKVCKSVRYQAEFFSAFYGPDFRDWVKELKTCRKTWARSRIPTSWLVYWRISPILLTVSPNSMGPWPIGGRLPWPIGKPCASVTSPLVFGRPYIYKS